MAYKFALLDPRPIPVSQTANDSVFASGPVYGIEVTVPALAKRCIYNLDPQHSGGDASRAAIEVACGLLAAYEKGRPCCGGGWDTYNCPKCDGADCPPPIPPKGATLATIRADLDSVGTMAIFVIRARGGLWELHQDQDSEYAFDCRVIAVAESDKFARGGWLGQRPLPTHENPWPEETASAESSRPLAAIAAAVMDFKVPLADRVSTMERWLLTGDEPEQYRKQVEKERQDLISALEKCEIQVSDEWRGSGYGVATVVSSHRAATSIGYRRAPVVVALNPIFRFQGSEPHEKFTACQFQAGYVDLRSAAQKLTIAEILRHRKLGIVFPRDAEGKEVLPTWGGSPTIIGSPQGVGSKLTIEEVVDVVRRHLLK